MDHELPLHRDILIGADAIAAEIGIDARKVYHWLQHGYLPANKVSALWTSTRSALRAHFSGDSSGSRECARAKREGPPPIRRRADPLRVSLLMG
jgi:hypothetical protein